MENKRSTNLCSIYILPLLDLNRWSFGETDNFVNSYVSEDNSYLVVQLKKTWPSAMHNNMFRFDFQKDGYTYYVFEVSQHFEVVSKFREGKYSQFPDQAKNQIKKKSGLSWRVPIPSGVKSAKELLALDRAKELKQELEKSLSNPGSPVKLADTAELMSIPGEDNFYQLNLTKSNDLAIIQ